MGSKTLGYKRPIILSYFYVSFQVKAQIGIMLGLLSKLPTMKQQQQAEVGVAPGKAPPSADEAAAKKEEKAAKKKRKAEEGVGKKSPKKAKEKSAKE